MISRTIVPIVAQDDIFAGAGPIAAALKQSAGGWTHGAQFNHICSLR